MVSMETQTTAETKTQSSAQMRKTVLLALGGTVIFLLIILLVSSLILGFMGYRYLQTFAQTADTTPKEVISTVRSSVEQENIDALADEKVTILLLGLDSLDTRPGSPALTDTILLLTFSPKTGQVATLPLPRDLWSEAYQTKINALYYYGLERNPEAPQNFPTQVISEMTGLTIDYTVPLTLEQVAQIIDLLDGVTINNPAAFTDTEFPNPDVDVTTETDPTVLYQTISFEEGEQQLNSEKALQYIRSRKAEGDEGTDISRSGRQQRVIEAMVAKILQPETLVNPSITGALYAYYINTFAEHLPFTDMVFIAKQALPVRDTIAFDPKSLSIEDENESGVIYHPPVSETNDIWVYAISDENEFRTFVQNALE